MVIKKIWILPVLVSLFGITYLAQAQPEVKDKAQTIVIKMVDKSTTQWRFEPANVSVQRGDTLQFVQEDFVPHNVEFKKVPKGTSLGDAMMGPFLLAKGETYTLVIDERFAQGIHKYICTPHEAMGMVGTIDVKQRNTDNISDSL